MVNLKLARHGSDLEEFSTLRGRPGHVLAVQLLWQDLWNSYDGETQKCDVQTNDD